jgi:spermidine synthase
VRVVIERCATPRGEIQIQRRGDAYEIISNGVFLSASTDGPSNRLLVRAALDRSTRPPRSLLIGGLGAGGTLEEAVAQPGLRRIVVVEIEEAVIRWNRDHLGSLCGHPLRDSRVEVIEADLVHWVSETGDTFDAACVDIDNGPEWTVTDDNVDLYTDDGLARLVRLIQTDGSVAFWSAHRSLPFIERLRGHLSDLVEVSVPAPRGEPDRIYVGRVTPAERP